MSTMERILRLMAEKKASDVYLSAHAPAMASAIAVDTEFSASGRSRTISATYPCSCRSTRTRRACSSLTDPLSFIV